MTALHFDAEIHDGVLSLPPSAKSAFEGSVHVILVKADESTGEDLITELLASPVDISAFRPLSREEANGR